MSLSIYADFASSCDAEDAVRELRAMGLAQDQIALSVHTHEEANAPERMQSPSGLIFAIGLGAIIGGVTGVCLSPLTVWLAYNNPVAYALTPLIAGALGALVGLIFGTMSAVADHSPVQESLLLCAQVEKDRTTPACDLLRRLHGESILVTGEAPEKNDSVAERLAEREVVEGRAVEIAPISLPNLEQETLTHS